MEEREGKKFANSINASYFETSSKNHAQVEDLFRQVTKKYLDTHPEPSGNSANKSKG